MNQAPVVGVLVMDIAIFGFDSRVGQLGHCHQRLAIAATFVLPRRYAADMGPSPVIRFGIILLHFYKSSFPNGSTMFRM